MKYLLIILIPFTINAKPLVVHKCILGNGTISYQKEPCIEDTTTIQENQLKSKSRDELIAEISKKLDHFSIDLKSYNITLVTVKNWRVFKKHLGDNLLHLKFVDDSKGSEMSLLIDFILPKNNKTFSEKELKELVIKMGQRMLTGSIQDNVIPEVIKIKDGVGVVANFTDKLLVNKSSYPPGEYLNTTIGLIFKKGFYMHFTLLSNNKESLNHIMAFNSMVNGIEITKLKKITHTQKNSDPLDKAYSNYENGNKRESVAMFESVIKEMPENFEAWIGYCLALRDTNRLQKAFIACDKALSLDPKNPEVFNSLVNLYTVAREWKQGIQFIEKIVPKLKNENLINGITNFGFYAMIDDDLDVAEQAFKVVKAIGSIEPRLDVDIASIKYLKGEKAKAISIVDKVINANPNDKYAKAALTLIKANQFTYNPYDNKTPYQKIPQRLIQLGYSKNIKQKPDEWVKKYFPVKGIGTITIEVPENWYDNVQITATDNETNEIEIVLPDLTNYSILRISIGKVDDSWNADDIKKQINASLGIFFKEKAINLKKLTNKKVGYKFSGTTLQEGKQLSIYAQSELRKNLYIKALVVGYKESKELLKASKRGCKLKCVTSF